MWRHGDVFIEAVKSIPKAAKQLPHCVLAEGEITGHCHEIREPDTAELWRSGNSLYLRVLAKRATVIHQEHDEIQLPKGHYRVWIQREYEPKAPQRYRRVVN